MNKVVDKTESIQHKDQETFDRVPVLEQQFEERYNRQTEVYRAITMGEDKLVDHVTIHLVEDGTKYVITEYLTKEGLTDYVLSGKDGDLRKYKDYLQAEVFVADLIGQEKRKEKISGNT